MQDECLALIGWFGVPCTWQVGYVQDECLALIGWFGVPCTGAHVTGHVSQFQHSVD